MLKSIFARSKNNPILKPDQSNDWESKKVYNCGAIHENDKYHLLYRFHLLLWYIQVSGLICQVFNWLQF